MSAENPSVEIKSNIPEFSVSDLASSLKRTLEDHYGHVRVRGELSRVSIAASGHMYSSLKDDDAVIDAVCWKGTLSKLAVRPEEGLEVICTGRISSYPKSSKYQLIIESMEHAGEGALLKMLEERKKKLAAEGLFHEDRKKPLPFLPQTIGVITSPTGAVIRDILHRLRDRFPRHVLLWPVLVQGNGSAEQIANALNGFNALPESDSQKPDLIIVARGGGSLEDLMAFNEENVVRAVAQCQIPIISAVGHETDTTLCDFAADVRAPTPTGAAEIAVPVRVNLMAQILEDEQRLVSSMNRLINEAGHRLDAVSSKLKNPAQLLENKTQHLDLLMEKLSGIFSQSIGDLSLKLINVSAKIRHPKDRLDDANKSFERWSEQFDIIRQKLTQDHEKRLEHSTKMLQAYSYENVLNRGFAVIRTEDGRIISKADQAKAGQNIDIEFQGQKHLAACIDGPKKPKAKSKKSEDQNQTQLF